MPRDGEQELKSCKVKELFGSLDVICKAARLLWVVEPDGHVAA